MDYRLKVLSIYELGQRKNQEDYIYPPIGGSNEGNRLFIVCDGMGGHENGEVASKTVCEKMSEYIAANYNGEDVFTEELFNAALAHAYDALDALDDSAEKKMGTTLTFLMFHSDGCLLAHIGDSRIYHIRPSETGAARIRYVTRDHSLVNDLVAIGEMTEEEAKTSRQKNVITRAIQPNQERRSKADIYNIEDVRAGDYFYMCSDGMLEQAEDEEIANIISMDRKTDEEKVEMFRALTKDNKDNHSAHLIKVLSVSGIEEAVTEAKVDERNYVKLLGIFAFILAALFCLWLFRDSIKKPDIPSEPVQHEQPQQPTPQRQEPHKPTQQPQEPQQSQHSLEPQVPQSQQQPPQQQPQPQQQQEPQQPQQQETVDSGVAAGLNELKETKKEEERRDQFVEQAKGKKQGFVL